MYTFKNNFALVFVQRNIQKKTAQKSCLNKNMTES